MKRIAAFLLGVLLLIAMFPAAALAAPDTYVSAEAICTPGRLPASGGTVTLEVIVHLSSSSPEESVENIQVSCNGVTGSIAAVYQGGGDSAILAIPISASQVGKAQSYTVTLSLIHILWYHGSTRNMNVCMATAAACVVAEVDEIGEIDPDNVVVPGLFVDALVLRGNEG